MSNKDPIKPKVLFLLKLLFNRRILGLLMNSKTRNMMKALRSGSAFIYKLNRFPEKTAIVYGEKRFTYRDFLNRINRFNNGLLALGLKTEVTPSMSDLVGKLEDTLTRLDAILDEEAGARS